MTKEHLLRKVQGHVRKFTRQSAQFSISTSTSQSLVYEYEYATLLGLE